jgi:hypothetical protein
MPPSSGKKPVQLGLIDRASSYLHKFISEMFVFRRPGGYASEIGSATIRPQSSWWPPRSTGGTPISSESHDQMMPAQLSDFY